MVTGASGLLGGAVLRHLAAHGLAVEGWAQGTVAAPDGITFRRLELTEPGVPERALDEARPDLVVHCAALTDVDRCEDDPDGARRLNAEVPGRLAAAAARLGARFVHVSTDAVYDGDAPGRHAETDAPAPANVYARTKLEGEHAVLDANPDALAVRTTMHGWTAQGRLSFSESLLRGLSRGDRLTLFADVSFSPLVVSDLASVLHRLAATSASGVVNAGAAAPVTKEAFGRLVAREFGLSEDTIVPIEVASLGLRAPRPRNLGLAVERVTELLGEPPPTVEDGIRRLRETAEAGTAARLKGRAALDLTAL